MEPERVLRHASWHVAALAGLASAGWCAGGEEEVEEIVVTWRGEDHTLQELHASAAAAAEVVESWQPFLLDVGYRAVLGDDARVLLLLSPNYQRRSPRKEHREVGVMLELIAQAAEVLGRVLPSPEEGAPPAVIVSVRSDDYRRLLDHVADLDAHIAEWARRAAEAVCGFVLSEPLVAAWIEDPRGVEEWHPYNELVHRAAQLLVRQRYPHLPAWVLLGLAWHVEDSVRAKIYCFPYRAGFVASNSHTDWGLWLANEFKPSRRRADDRPLVLDVAEFAEWSPREARFDEQTAYLAFGVARFLAHVHPDDLASVLEQLGEATAEGRKVWITETEWRLEPDYQVPAARQRAVLEELDPEIWREITRFFVSKKANERRAPKVGDRHW